MESPFLAALTRLDVDAMVAALAPDARFEVEGVVALRGRDSIRYFLQRLRAALADGRTDVRGTGAGLTFALGGTAVDGTAFAANGSLRVEEGTGGVVAVRLAGDADKVRDLLDRAQRFAVRLDFAND